METIILPGYSQHNKTWAYEVKNILGMGAAVYEWKHWKTNKSMSVKSEVEEIIKIILSNKGKKVKKVNKVNKVNIVSKSVGTRIAMFLLMKIPERLNKIVLCGIPTKGDGKKLRVDKQVVDKSENIYFQGLSQIDPSSVIIFQNQSDPFAKYEDIKRFIGGMFPDIKVIEKERNDHEYPYFEEISSFLSPTSSS